MPQPTIPIPTLTPVAALPTAAEPGAIPTPTPVAASPTPAPAATELIAPDSERPLRDFGPAARSGQWLVTLRDFSSPLFVLHNLRTDPNQPTAFGLGQPWGWSNDGALLLWTPSDQPGALLGMEPTSGLTVTIDTTERGSVVGAAWLRASLQYAVQTPAALQVLQITADAPAQVAAQLLERTLLPGGLLANPAGDQVALLVTHTLTTELYLFDPLVGSIELVDAAASQGAARVVWAPQGTLYYNLGGELRAYEPALGLVTPAGVDALPLDWSPLGLLARQRADDALLRWRTDGLVQPFESGGTPVLVKAAQAQVGTQVLALINGAVWQTVLP